MRKLPFESRPQFQSLCVPATPPFGEGEDWEWAQNTDWRNAAEGKWEIINGQKKQKWLRCLQILTVFPCCNKGSLNSRSYFLTVHISKLRDWNMFTYVYIWNNFTKDLQRTQAIRVITDGRAEKLWTVRYSMPSGSFPSHCLHNTEHSKHFADTYDLTSHVLCLRGDMLV